MANALYSKGKEALLNKEIDMNTDTIKAALVDGYTASVTTHVYLSDLTGAGGSLTASATLTTPTITDGAFNADDVTFTAVAGGSTPDYIVIYQDTGSSATSHLIALIDTTTGVTLPVTTNGGDITITWGTNIFSL